MPVDLNGNTDNTDTFIFGPFGFSLNIFIEIFATFLFCSVGTKGEVWVALPQLPVSQVMFSAVPELTT